MYMKMEFVTRPSRRRPAGTYYDGEKQVQVLSSCTIHLPHDRQSPMKNLEVKFSLSELEFRCKNLFLIYMGKAWGSKGAGAHRLVGGVGF